MFILLIIVHIIVCLILIATILLQAGRGGGLADMFGGGDSVQSVLGTQAPTLLKKATEVSAILFLITSLSLGIVTARRGKSIFESAKLPALPAMPADVQTTAKTPKAAAEVTDAEAKKAAQEAKVVETSETEAPIEDAVQ